MHKNMFSFISIQSKMTYFVKILLKHIYVCAHLKKSIFITFLQQISNCRYAHFKLHKHVKTLNLNRTKRLVTVQEI